MQRKRKELFQFPCLESLQMGPNIMHRWLLRRVNMDPTNSSALNSAEVVVTIKVAWKSKISASSSQLHKSFTFSFLRNIVVHQQSEPSLFSCKIKSSPFLFLIFWPGHWRGSNKEKQSTMFLAIHWLICQWSFTGQLELYLQHQIKKKPPV